MTRAAPYTRDEQYNHGYLYDIPLGFQASSIYLSNYQARANSGSGETRELGTSIGSNWAMNLSSTHGDIAIGSSSQMLASFTNEGARDECFNCVIDFPVDGKVYSASGQFSTLRLGWQEGGSQYEGWFPWWAGSIFVR